MTQLEQQIVATLRDRADDSVDVTLLLDAAQQQGAGYRRRRRALSVGGGAVLGVATVVAVLGAVVAAPRPDPARSLIGTGTDRSPSASASTPYVPVLRPPVQAGATPATVDPKVVGADPTLFHFDLADAALPPDALIQWTSVDGLERLTVQPDSNGALVQVQVSRISGLLDPMSGTTRSVSVGGRPGTLVMSGHDEYGQLRWQPVPGLWAQVQGPGAAADITRVAGLVSFDHVLRCVVPFRLTDVPAGARVQACSSVFEPRGATGSATVHIGQYAVTVELDRFATLPDPTTTVNGRPAKVRQYPGDGGAQILQVDIDERDSVLDLLAEGRYDPTTVLALAAGVVLVDGQPDGWPSPRAS